MRSLFYHAVASHPAVVGALMGQAEASLKPFSRFIAQATRSAEKRQVRYTLDWEPSQEAKTLALAPIQTWLRWPKNPTRVLVTNWPQEQHPDLTKDGFLPDKSQAVKVKSATATALGLALETQPDLDPTDQFLWCKVDCALVPEPTASIPASLVTKDGLKLEVLKFLEQAPGDFNEVLVQGCHGSPLLLLDGKEVQAESLPATDGLDYLTDEAGNAFPYSSGMLRTVEPPSSSLLTGNNGVQFRWSSDSGRGQQGHWVSLVSPKSKDQDLFMDPRAAFCEDEVKEIWTQPRHSAESVIKVLRVDRNRYQLLLEKLPPVGCKLHLPLDVRQLKLQQRAFHQLNLAPLPFHQGLLRLCEDPEKAAWPQVRPKSNPDRWYSLVDETRNGTEEQRQFVIKALNTPDLAILEGPPGSGKTTAICELIQQLVLRQQRVLLCASTNVAIDNVLERLAGCSEVPLFPVRIGAPDRVDERVRVFQLDARVEAMTKIIKGAKGSNEMAPGDVIGAAQRAVFMAANLTCGTTMGIVNHPLFEDRDHSLKPEERPITTMPHWDVLIIDEASKTLVQEFMVPALMAKRWVVVGDVRQLPPFADSSDIKANLRDLSDANGKLVFPAEHQRACLLLYRLLDRTRRQPGMRWLVAEPSNVIDLLVKELEARGLKDPPTVVRVCRAKRLGPIGPVKELLLRDLQQGSTEALWLAGADWVLVPRDLLAATMEFLPADLLSVSLELRSEDEFCTNLLPLCNRHSLWLGRVPNLARRYRDRGYGRDEVVTFAEAERCEQHNLKRRDHADELSWRLTRLHELRRSSNEKEKRRLADGIASLKPCIQGSAEPIDEIQDIGLPSVLEVLQTGIGADKSKRQSALCLGMRAKNEAVFQTRFGSLSYQHRMHPDISILPRELFYGGADLLRNANTIESRDKLIGWDLDLFPSRSIWLDVDGSDANGENLAEVAVIREQIAKVLEWAKKKGSPAGRKHGRWELACLCFYVKQERALAHMLQGFPGAGLGKTRFVFSDAPLEVVCGTVDRFQGREADLVFLSMRNTTKTGFLDSPNRLNVALTRARQQLVVVGKAGYFEGCRVPELEELTKKTPRQTVRTPIKAREYRR